MNRYALAALVLVAFALTIAGFHSRRTLSAAERSEIERVQAHIASAERVLEGHVLASLTRGQKQARATHISRLKAYRERGLFPHNHDFRGERRPYFVDDHGVLCAMAHLISESGRDDIVRLVQRTHNNATVLELAADAVIGPVLAAWLDEAGLTVAEAQRIQPEYGWGALSFEDEEISTGYAVASAALGGLNLTTSILNVTSGSRTGSPEWSSYVGLFGGLAGIALGGAMLAQEESLTEFHVGVGNAVVGMVATLAGATAIARAGKAPSPLEQAAEHDPDGVTFSPTVHMGRAPGVGVSMKF